MKKKLLALTIVSALCVTSLVACGNKTEPNVTQNTFTGTKSVEYPADTTGKINETILANVTFENGTPVDVSFDIRFEDGSLKDELSKNGGYGMDEIANKPWHEQVDLMESYLKEIKFDLDSINYTDEVGHTDAISGVSIKVKPFMDAVNKAIEEANTQQQ